LVVVLSVRPGTLSWHRELERLPGRLAELVPESFIMVYPSQLQPAAPPDFRGTVLPRALLPERVVFDLPRMSYRSALEELLRTTFADRPERVREVAQMLAAGEEQFSSEISPGVAVPHALVSGLKEPMMFLGISPEGIELPGAKEPARLIFLLLSPIDRPQEHLKTLTDVARLVRKPERVQRLLESRTVEDLLESFRARRAIPVIR
ncbi:MAG TPA: PTS sugar transporter subunit IIA, partial [Longimicrobiaceae bacterium]|nr:PTS sugar transporter subunit IIA [Longimicrobiaceae bacterium]